MTLLVAWHASGCSLKHDQPSRLSVPFAPRRVRGRLRRCRTRHARRRDGRPLGDGHDADARLRDGLRVVLLLRGRRRRSALLLRGCVDLSRGVLALFGRRVSLPARPRHAVLSAACSRRGRAHGRRRPLPERNRLLRVSRGEHPRGELPERGVLRDALQRSVPRVRADGPRRRPGFRNRRSLRVRWSALGVPVGQRNRLRGSHHLLARGAPADVPVARRRVTHPAAGRCRRPDCGARRTRSRRTRGG